MEKSTTQFSKLFVWIVCIGCVIATGSLFATGTTQTVGSMASNITSSFTNLAKLVTGGSYVVGLAFAVTAIMKFKQHKDNPTQIPIGTPVALVFIAAALLFLPSILNVAGATMFGSGAEVSGPTGSIFTSS